jgi:hypothetical protein
MSAEPQTKEEKNVWAKYEQMKLELPKDLTPEQREQECRRIADALGI